jgi:hypothetical protein
MRNPKVSLEEWAESLSPEQRQRLFEAALAREKSPAQPSKSASLEQALGPSLPGAEPLAHGAGLGAAADHTERSRCRHKRPDAVLLTQPAALGAFGTIFRLLGTSSEQKKWGAELSPHYTTTFSITLVRVREFSNKKNSGALVASGNAKGAERLQSLDPIECHGYLPKRPRDY